MAVPNFEWMGRYILDFIIPGNSVVPAAMFRNIDAFAKKPVYEISLTTDAGVPLFLVGRSPVGEHPVG